jgi:hypothetical protein
MGTKPLLIAKSLGGCILNNLVERKIISFLLIYTLCTKQKCFVFSFKCTEHAVPQLVVALRYKPESCGFYSRWCDWNFSLT